MLVVVHRGQGVVAILPSRRFFVESRNAGTRISVTQNVQVGLQHNASMPYRKSDYGMKIIQARICECRVSDPAFFVL